MSTITDLVYATQRSVCRPRGPSVAPAEDGVVAVESMADVVTVIPLSTVW